VSTWEDYRSAGFAVDVPQVGRFWVLPAPAGTAAGEFLPGRVGVFVTAHNPRGEVIDDAQNVERHGDLLALVEDGEWTWWPAMGGLPDAGPHEDGVLLLDATPADGMLVGRRFEQDAIYVWRPDAFELVACDGSRRDVLGWRCYPA
jgi:hypothetical protein